MNPTQPTILIVDDHTMFVDGVIEILKATGKYQIIGSAANGEEALKILSIKKADLVIADLRMKHMDGHELTRAIHAHHRDTKVLMVSMHNDPYIINDLLKNGITGYILKNSGKEELLTAINMLLESKTYFSPEVKSSFINSKVLSSQVGDLSISLTRREKEVLQLIAAEYTTNEIAEKLFISNNTAETHRKNILKKLQVKNSVGIIKRAIELGLLD